MLLTPICYGQNWSTFDEPFISEQSQKISNSVSALPEHHLATARDKSNAANLLLKVLTAQQTHTLRLNSELTAFKAEPLDSIWSQVNTTKQSLDSLSQNKAELLDYVEPQVNDKFTGFGPDGVRQVLLEAQIAKAIINFQLIAQYRNLTEFFSDLKVSPFPLLVLVFKVSLIYLVLKWWLKVGPKLIASRLTKIKIARLKREPISGIFWRYLNKIHKSIAWFLAISVLLNLLSDLPGLGNIIYLSVVVNWVFSATITINLVNEFTAHHSRHNDISEIVSLRVKTIKQWVWLIMTSGIILKVTQMSVYQGTIYSWIRTFTLIAFTLLLIKSLNDWRKIVFTLLKQTDEHPSYIKWATKHQNSRLLAPVATALAVFSLLHHLAFHKIFNNLLRYQMFKHAIAYFFRIEVAKQSVADKENTNMTRVKGDEAFLYVKPGQEHSPLVEDYAEDELNELARYVLAPVPALALVYSERGLGLTTLFKRLIHRSKSDSAIYINCPYGGYSQLIAQLNLALDLTEAASEAELIQLLRQSEQRFIICIDNCQRLVSPKVTGLTDLMKLTKLLRRGRNAHGVVIGMEQSAWRFIDRARGERLLFDKVIAMPRWNEKQVAALLNSRIDSEGEYALSFAGLKLPKQWDEQELSEQQRAEQGFYRILWDYSDGNPTVALRFFRMSLHKDKTNGNVFVRIFSAPDAKELETMPKAMLAVLRAIVQLEVASAEELSACTQLGFSEVINTLRYFQNRGFVEMLDDKARISDHWFRYITNTLHNQHLLVK